MTNGDLRHNGIALATCLICGSKNVRSKRLALLSLKELPILICSDCGYARRSDQRSFEDNLTTQTNIHDQYSLPNLRYTKWPHRPALIRREIEKIQGQTGKTLDIGCGNGQWLLTLGAGWEKNGLELSNAGAQMARELSSANVFCGPLESYDTPHTFDLITAFAIIEHLSDPRILVSWSQRHLKLGGLLVLYTGDTESETALKMGEKWPLYDCEDHVSYFSARAVRRLLLETGFKVVREEWRFMYLANGEQPRAIKVIQKLKEIVRMVQYPKHDHYYCYAIKIK